MRFFAAAALLFSLTAHADPKAEVFAAWDAMIKAKSYRAAMEISTGGQTYQQNLDIIIPDHFRMSGGPAGDTIVTPAGAWMKPPGGQWTAAPDSMRAMTKQFMGDDFIAQAKAGVTKVEAKGEQDLGGVATKVYEVHQTMKVMGVESSSVTDLYVAVDSGRPVRQVIKATAMGQTSTTTQDITYVPDLKIEAPM